MPLPEVGFYHLQRSALEPALGRLLEKVLAAGHCAVVQASSAERIDALNLALWTYSRDAFLPHGTRDDGEPEEQPVFLTAGPDQPESADVLVLVDGAEAEPGPRIARLVYMFDGNDDAAVKRARELWRGWKERGAALTYWQQTERGWQKAG